MKPGIYVFYLENKENIFKLQSTQSKIWIQKQAKANDLF